MRLSRRPNQPLSGSLIPGSRIAGGSGVFGSKYLLTFSSGTGGPVRGRSGASLGWNDSKQNGHVRREKATNTGASSSGEHHNRIPPSGSGTSRNHESSRPSRQNSATGTGSGRAGRVNGGVVYGMSGPARVPAGTRASTGRVPISTGKLRSPL